MRYKIEIAITIFSFSCVCLIAPAPFIEKVTPSPLNSLHCYQASPGHFFVQLILSSHFVPLMVCVYPSTSTMLSQLV